MDSRHFVFRHLGVSADQYNQGALLAAESVTKSVRPLWEYGPENNVGNHIMSLTTTTTTTLTLFLQFLKGLCSPQLAQLFWAGYLN